MVPLKTLGILQKYGIFSFHRIIASRTLYCDQTLQLQLLRRHWLDVRRVAKNPDTFKLELTKYLENVRPLQLSSLNDASEKLVAYLNNTQDDLELLKKLLLAKTHFSSMSIDERRAEGNFVMKKMLVQKNEDGATQLYSDPRLKTFFNGFMSTLLYCDLLYNSGKYELILSLDPEAFQPTREKSQRFAKFFDLLILGACYKVNTLESFERAYALWKNIEQNKPFERTVAFMAALAFNQNKLDLAANISGRFPGNVASKQIQWLYLIQLGSASAVMGELSLIRKPHVCRDVLEAMKNATNTSVVFQNTNDFQNYHEFLANRSLIATETLDELLDEPVSTRLDLWSQTTKEINQKFIDTG